MKVIACPDKEKKKCDDCPYKKICDYWKKKLKKKNRSPDTKQLLSWFNCISPWITPYL